MTLTWIIRAHIFVSDGKGNYAEINEKQITGLDWEEDKDDQ